MCTVTFIPSFHGGFILTSNRDEAPDRNTLPPKRYDENEVSLIYPKDKKAGGTWLGTSSKKRLVCLLNGGFTAHKREESYRISRGIIVTNLLRCQNAKSEIKNYDFSNIEPFTIILIEWEKGLQIFEFVWDGSSVHFQEKPIEPQIWSSSLLFTAPMKLKREKWFAEFLLTKVQPSEDDLINFHKTTGDGNKNSDLVIDRGFVKTKSITQVIMHDDLGSMKYADLETSQITIINF